MSTVLRNELDVKLQQMKEYALIAHGYHNENLRYPVQVRRSHDGEKLAHVDRRHPRPTVLTPLPAENRTRSKREATSTHRPPSPDEHATTLAIVPPNKTISDIHPLFHRDRFHSLRNTSTTSVSASSSSSRHGSTRPHSIAGTSSRTTDDSSTQTLTRRLISKLFHQPAKV